MTILATARQHDDAGPCEDGTQARARQSEKALESAFALALSHLNREHRLPRPGDRSPRQLREELGIALGREGISLAAVVEKLEVLLAETPSSASPRFFNQLFGGRDDVAVVAEMLTPLVNTSMYTYKAAGPQVLVEQEVLSRMAAKVGFANGEGLFTAGGSLANLIAALIARNAAVPGIRDRGFARVDQEQLICYTSADGHYSIRKNAGILGLGRESVREIPTDDQGRMSVTMLERSIREDFGLGRRPLMINATAGTTVLGAFDPLRRIARVAREHDMWFHVDGALGGSVLLSEEHRHLLDGCELADSFSWNAHKMMGVPLSCSALLLAKEDLLARNLGEAADYLFQGDGDVLNPGTRSLQCGRRNDALKLWAAWQLHGDRGYQERLDKLFDLARYAASVIDADPELDLLMTPPSVNVCFEIRGKPSLDICARLGATGRLLIGHGLIKGRRGIRLVCINPDLDRRDIDEALARVKQASEEVPHQAGQESR